MKWYKHYLGDYDADTAHLTWDEDMAYTRLLRAYYRREGPLPEKDVYRLTRALGSQQRAAMDSVLREFFKLDETSSWRNSRADKEIESYKNQAQTNKRIATNRYTNRARTVHESSTNRAPNQKLDIRKALDLSSIGRQQEPRHILGSNETSNPLNNSKAENPEPDALEQRAKAVGITQREGEPRGQFALRVAQASADQPVESQLGLSPKGKFDDP